MNFRNTVVTMTSNIGSLYFLDGIDASGEIMEDVRDRVMAELRGHFRPEFLNRVDETILFKPLTLAEIERIVDLQMGGPAPAPGRPPDHDGAERAGARADRPPGL